MAMVKVRVGGQRLSRLTITQYLWSKFNQTSEKGKAGYETVCLMQD